MGISALQKPWGERCPNLGDVGCAIYASRPAECAEFNCWWFVSPELPEGMRPDRSGILVWSEPASFGQPDAVDGTPHLTWARETRPGALEGYWARKMLKQLSSRLLIYGIRHGENVPDSTRIFGPPDLVAAALRREGSRTQGNHGSG
ncbi:MAG TPA: hypothetical protein VFL36_04820 [Myxococcales bacterium]|nr:hypothetical protein [Myxococcales bacterium]